MASGWGKISESKRNQKNVIILFPGPFVGPVEATVLLAIIMHLSCLVLFCFFSLSFDRVKISSCVHHKKVYT